MACVFTGETPVPPAHLPDAEVGTPRWFATIMRPHPLSGDALTLSSHWRILGEDFD